MNLQEELKALKERIAELEELTKEEVEFPQERDPYWYNNHYGVTSFSFWEGNNTETRMLELGNIYKTEQQAEFALEKLKVEGELRKLSRPFILGEENWYLNTLSRKDITIAYDYYSIHQGTVYFKSKDKVKEVIESVGEERIKKYIFGIE